MCHLTILVATALAVAAAPSSEMETFRQNLFLSEENTRNSALEQLVLGMIEELRDIMITGSDTIPVLDPLVIDEIHIDQNTIAGMPGHISVKDMTINDLSTFEINELSITMTSLIQQRFRIILDGSVPAINIDAGAYDINLTLFGGSIFGAGDATINIVQPRVYADIIFSIRFSGGIFLHLLECRVNVSLDEFNPTITGMFNDPVASDFLSAFLKRLVEEVLVFFKEDITELLSATVLEYGNKILAELDLSGILGL